MEASKRFLELKKAWIAAKDEKKRVEIDGEIDKLFQSLTEKEKQEVVQAASGELKKVTAEAKELNETLDVREQLSDVLPAISVSYLAKEYFGRSASWFYQRMNGNIVHGKPAKFTQDELNTLSRALKELSQNLSQTSKKLAV